MFEKEILRILPTSLSCFEIRLQIMGVKEEISLVTRMADEHLTE